MSRKVARLAKIIYCNYKKDCALASSREKTCFYGFIIVNGKEEVLTKSNAP